VTYRTAYFAVDKKWHLCEEKTRFIGGGLVFNHDWAGDGNLGTTQLGLNLAYTTRVAKKNWHFQHPNQAKRTRWDLGVGLAAHRVLNWWCN